MYVSQKKFADHVFLVLGIHAFLQHTKTSMEFKKLKHDKIFYIFV